MSELQQVIDDVAKGIASVENYGSEIVGISKHEAQTLIAAAQLTAPLQERCELLGRALAAVWSLVGEEDQRAIMTVLDASAGSGNTLSAQDWPPVGRPPGHEHRTFRVVSGDW